MATKMRQFATFACKLDSPLVDEQHHYLFVIYLQRKEGEKKSIMIMVKLNDKTE